MNKTIVLSIICIFAVSGCCRIMTGTKQEIPITSNPKGATITLNNIQSKVTPDVLSISRKGQYNITAEFQGYKSQTIKLKRNINNWLLADLLWDFGIITWPIDFISGSAYDYSPKSIHFELEPDHIISESGEKLELIGYRATTDSQGRVVTTPVYK